MSAKRDGPQRASPEGATAAKRFVRRLNSAPDSGQWPVLVRRWLSPASPLASGADRLQALLELALRGSGRDGWLAFARVFCASGLGKDLEDRLFSEAADLGFFAVRGLFLLNGEEAGLAVHASAIAQDDVLGSLTLGERKARARKPDPRLIERLSLDADGSVIRILLKNARLTEPLVVRLCARRPHRAPALAEVARSKWLARRDVQRALAFNPYSPARVVAVLLPLITAPERADVERAQGTHAVVAKLAEMCRRLA